MRDLAPVGVDQERDLGEGIEGNPDREQKVHREAGREQGIEIGGNEAGIFEDAEHQKIAAHAGRQHRPPRQGAQTLRHQQQADQVVERDRRQQQQHKLPVAHRVEGQRRQRQPDHRRQIADPAEREIAEQDHRQEQKNERVGVEKHQAFSGACRKSLTIQPVNKRARHAKANQQASAARGLLGARAAYLAIRWREPI